MPKTSKTPSKPNPNESSKLITQIGHIQTDIGKNAMVSSPPPSKPKETKTSK